MVQRYSQRHLQPQPPRPRYDDYEADDRDYGTSRPVQDARYDEDDGESTIVPTDVATDLSQLPPANGGSRAKFAADPVADLTYFDREASPATVPHVRQPSPQPAAAHQRTRTPQPQLEYEPPRSAYGANLTVPGSSNRPRASPQPAPAVRMLPVPQPVVQPRSQPYYEDDDEEESQDGYQEAPRRTAYRDVAPAHGYADGFEDENSDFDSDDDAFTAVGTGVNSDITGDSDDEDDAPEEYKPDLTGRRDVAYDRFGHDDELEQVGPSGFPISHRRNQNYKEQRRDSFYDDEDDYNHQNGSQSPRARLARATTLPNSRPAQLSENPLHKFHDRPNQKSPRPQQQTRFASPLPAETLSDITTSTQDYEEPILRPTSRQLLQQRARSAAPILRAQPNLNEIVPRRTELPAPATARGRPLSGFDQPAPRRSKSPVVFARAQSPAANLSVRDEGIPRARSTGSISETAQKIERKGIESVKRVVQQELIPTEPLVEKELIRLLKEMNFSAALKDFHDTFGIGVQKTVVAEDGFGHAFCKIHCKKLPKHSDIEKEAHLAKHWLPIAGTRWEFRTASHRVTVVWLTQAVGAFQASTSRNC